MNYSGHHLGGVGKGGGEGNGYGSKIPARNSYSHLSASCSPPSFLPELGTPAILPSRSSFRYFQDGHPILSSGGSSSSFAGRAVSSPLISTTPGGVIRGFPKHLSSIFPSPSSVYPSCFGEEEQRAFGGVGGEDDVETSGHGNIPFRSPFRTKRRSSVTCSVPGLSPHGAAFVLAQVYGVKAVEIPSCAGAANPSLLSVAPPPPHETNTNHPHYMEDQHHPHHHHFLSKQRQKQEGKERKEREEGARRSASRQREEKEKSVSQQRGEGVREKERDGGLVMEGKPSDGGDGGTAGSASFFSPSLLCFLPKGATPSSVPAPVPAGAGEAGALSLPLPLPAGGGGGGGGVTGVGDEDGAGSRSDSILMSPSHMLGPPSTSLRRRTPVAISFADISLSSATPVSGAAGGGVAVGEERMKRKEEEEAESSSSAPSAAAVAPPPPPPAPPPPAALSHSSPPPSPEQGIDANLSSSTSIITTAPTPTATASTYHHTGTANAGAGTTMGVWKRRESRPNHLIVPPISLLSASRPPPLCSSPFLSSIGRSAQKEKGNSDPVEGEESGEGFTKGEVTNSHPNNHTKTKTTSNNTEVVSPVWYPPGFLRSNPLNPFAEVEDAYYSPTKMKKGPEQVQKQQSSSLPFPPSSSSFNGEKNVLISSSEKDGGDAFPFTPNTAFIAGEKLERHREKKRKSGGGRWRDEEEEEEEDESEMEGRRSFLPGGGGLPFTHCTADGLPLSMESIRQHKASVELRMAMRANREKMEAENNYWRRRRSSGLLLTGGDGIDTGRGGSTRHGGRKMSQATMIKKKKKKGMERKKSMIPSGDENKEGEEQDEEVEDESGEDGRKKKKKSRTGSSSHNKKRRRRRTSFSSSSEDEKVGFSPGLSLVRIKSFRSPSRRTRTASGYNTSSHNRATTTMTSAASSHPNNEEDKRRNIDRWGKEKKVERRSQSSSRTGMGSPRTSILEVKRENKEEEERRETGEEEKKGDHGAEDHKGGGGEVSASRKQVLPHSSSSSALPPFIFPFSPPSPLIFGNHSTGGDGGGGGGGAGGQGQQQQQQQQRSWSPFLQGPSPFSASSSSVLFPSHPAVGAGGGGGGGEDVVIGGGFIQRLSMISSGGTRSSSSTSSENSWCSRSGGGNLPLPPRSHKRRVRGKAPTMRRTVSISLGGNELRPRGLSKLLFQVDDPSQYISPKRFRYTDSDDEDNSKEEDDDDQRDRRRSVLRKKWSTGKNVDRKGSRKSQSTAGIGSTRSPRGSYSNGGGGGQEEEEEERGGVVKGAARKRYLSQPSEESSLTTKNSFFCPRQPPPPHPHPHRGEMEEDRSTSPRTQQQQQAGIPARAWRSSRMSASTASTVSGSGTRSSGSSRGRSHLTSSEDDDENEEEGRRRKEEEEEEEERYDDNDVFTASVFQPRDRRFLQARGIGGSSMPRGRSTSTTPSTISPTAAAAGGMRSSIGQISPVRRAASRRNFSRLPSISAEEWRSASHRKSAARRMMLMKEKGDANSGGGGDEGGSLLTPFLGRSISHDVGRDPTHFSKDVRVVGGGGERKISALCSTMLTTTPLRTTSSPSKTTTTTSFAPPFPSLPSPPSSFSSSSPSAFLSLPLSDGAGAAGANDSGSVATGEESLEERRGKSGERMGKERSELQGDVAGRDKRDFEEKRKHQCTSKTKTEEDTSDWSGGHHQHHHKNAHAKKNHHTSGRKRSKRCSLIRLSQVKEGGGGEKEGAGGGYGGGGGDVEMVEVEEEDFPDRRLGEKKKSFANAHHHHYPAVITKKDTASRIICRPREDHVTYVPTGGVLGGEGGDDGEHNYGGTNVVWNWEWKWEIPNEPDEISYEEEEEEEEEERMDKQKKKTEEEELERHEGETDGAGGRRSNNDPTRIDIHSTKRNSLFLSHPSSSSPHINFSMKNEERHVSSSTSFSKQVSESRKTSFDGAPPSLPSLTPATLTTTSNTMNATITSRGADDYCDDDHVRKADEENGSTLQSSLESLLFSNHGVKSEKRVHDLEHTLPLPYCSATASTRPPTATSGISATSTRITTTTTTTSEEEHVLKEEEENNKKRHEDDDNERLLRDGRNRMNAACHDHPLHPTPMTILVPSSHSIHTLSKPNNGNHKRREDDEDFGTSTGGDGGGHPSFLPPPLCSSPGSVGEGSSGHFEPEGTSASFSSSFPLSGGSVFLSGGRRGGRGEGESSSSRSSPSTSANQKAGEQNTVHISPMLAVAETRKEWEKREEKGDEDVQKDSERNPCPSLDHHHHHQNSNNALGSGGSEGGNWRKHSHEDGRQRGEGGRMPFLSSFSSPFLPPLTRVSTCSPSSMSQRIHKEDRGSQSSRRTGGGNEDPVEKEEHVKGSQQGGPGMEESSRREQLKEREGSQGGRGPVDDTASTRLGKREKRGVTVGNESGTSLLPDEAHRTKMKKKKKSRRDGTEEEEEGESSPGEAETATAVVIGDFSFVISPPPPVLHIPLRSPGKFAGGGEGENTHEKKNKKTHAVSEWREPEEERKEKKRDRRNNKRNEEEEEEEEAGMREGKMKEQKGEHFPPTTEHYSGGTTTTAAKMTTATTAGASSGLSGAGGAGPASIMLVPESVGITTTSSSTFSSSSFSSTLDKNRGLGITRKYPMGGLVSSSGTHASPSCFPFQQNNFLSHAEGGHSPLMRSYSGIEDDDDDNGEESKRNHNNIIETERLLTSSPFSKDEIAEKYLCTGRGGEEKEEGERGGPPTSSASLGFREHANSVHSTRKLCLTTTFTPTSHASMGATRDHRHHHTSTSTILPPYNSNRTMVCISSSSRAPIRASYPQSAGIVSVSSGSETVAFPPASCEIAPPRPFSPLSHKINPTTHDEEKKTAATTTREGKEEEWKKKTTTESSHEDRSLRENLEEKKRQAKNKWNRLMSLRENKEVSGQVPLANAVLSSPSHLGSSVPPSPSSSSSSHPSSSSPALANLPQVSTLPTTRVSLGELEKYLAEHPDKNIIVIDGGLYDVTHFANDHPGGVSILKKYRGKECGMAFHRIHGRRGMEKAKPYFIGTLATQDDDEKDKKKKKEKKREEKGS